MEFLKEYRKKNQSETQKEAVPAQKMKSSITHADTQARKQPAKQKISFNSGLFGQSKFVEKNS